MENLASLLAFFAIGFAIAFTASWILIKAAVHLRNRLNPAPGAILRIRADSGSYRSHMIKLGGSVWTISAPIKRDSYVPLRAGEEVVIEAASKRGALLFRTVILARHAGNHTLTIKRPTRVHLVERREHKRWPHLEGAKVKVEGENAQLLDISEGGARIKTGFRLHKGDRVRVDMPWCEAMFGWVLSSEAGETRVRFEELMEIRPSKRETAPAV